MKCVCVFPYSFQSKFHTYPVCVRKFPFNSFFIVCICHVRTKINKKNSNNDSSFGVIFASKEKGSMKNETAKKQKTETKLSCFSNSPKNDQIHSIVDDGMHVNWVCGVCVSVDVKSFFLNVYVHRIQPC